MSQSQSQHADEGVAGKVGDSFLDKVVAVDEETATWRESTAVRKLGVIRRDSGFEEFLNEEAVRNGDGGGAGEDGESQVGFGGASGQTSRVVWAVGKEARGKTTRELSRLWAYLDGGVPIGVGMRRMGK